MTMMSDSRISHSRALFDLVLAGALAALGPADVWAQAASNVTCNKCVDTGDIAKKAVDSSRIKDGAVETADLGEGAVTGAKIADGAVDLADLSPAVQQLITDLQAQVAALQAQVTAAESKIAALQGDPVFGLSDLAAFVTVDTVPTLVGASTLDLPRVLFEEVNVQVVNGDVSQATDSLNGLGNLIVGYNEPRGSNVFAGAICSDGQFGNQFDCELGGEVWAVDHKSGSHNLVVGPGNAYSQAGGVVFGADNAVTRRAAAAIGGEINIARGEFSSISGGLGNIAVGSHSSVSGGNGNMTSGEDSSVSGGLDNDAVGPSSSIGGEINIARGEFSSVSGGNIVTIAGDCDWGGEDLGATLAEFGDGSC